MYAYNFYQHMALPVSYPMDFHFGDPIQDQDQDQDFGYYQYEYQALDQFKHHAPYQHQYIALGRYDGHYQYQCQLQDYSQFQVRGQHQGYQDHSLVAFRQPKMSTFHGIMLDASSVDFTGLQYLAEPLEPIQVLEDVKPPQGTQKFEQSQYLIDVEPAMSIQAWPLDIFLQFLEVLPSSTISSLCQTCKNFRELGIPILYKNVDLSFNVKNVAKSGLTADQKNLMKARQFKFMEAVLERPHYASYVRTFKFSLGVFCDARPDWSFFKVLSLLDRVESVTLTSSPDGRHLYPCLTLGLDNGVFPELKDIKLQGFMSYYMAEKFLGGQGKDKMKTVNLSVVLKNVPEELGEDPKRAVEHLVGKVMEANKGLKRKFVPEKKKTKKLKNPKNEEVMVKLCV